MDLTDSDADSLRTFERIAHDRIADGYARSFVSITNLAAGPLLDAAHVRADTRMLDVACGPGVVASVAAARGAVVVGADLSPNMLKVAQRLNPGVAFHEADVERMPFADGAFDAVVCAFGLGHFPRPEAAIRECRRLTTPGGWLAAAWWDDFSRQRLQGIFREAIAEVGLPPAPGVPRGHNVQRFADSNELRVLFDGVQLMDVMVETRTAALDVPDSEALWTIGMDSLGLTASAIRAASPDQQRATRAAFDRRAMAHTSGAGLRIPLAFKIVAGQRPQ
jgi:SAM-dependent methyltransferase